MGALFKRKRPSKNKPDTVKAKGNSGDDHQDEALDWEVPVGVPSNQAVVQETVRQETVLQEGVVNKERLPEHSAYLDFTEIKEELWETIQQARPQRQAHSKTRNQASYLYKQVSNPEFVLGALMLGMVIHFALIRPRYRNIRDNPVGNRQQRDALLRQVSSLSEDQTERGAAVPVSPWEEETNRAGSPDSTEVVVEQRDLTQQQFPNSLNTPERSRALHVPSPPPSSSSSSTGVSTNPNKNTSSEEPGHSHAIPQPPTTAAAPASSASEALAAQLRERQTEWQAFQDDVHAKETESVRQIQNLQNEIRLQEASPGEEDLAIEDLRDTLQALESDLRQFQTAARAMNMEYQSQVEALQNDLLAASTLTIATTTTTSNAPNDTNVTATTDETIAQSEEMAPETSRPPPAARDSSSPDPASPVAQPAPAPVQPASPASVGAVSASTSASTSSAFQAITRKKPQVSLQSYLPQRLGSAHSNRSLLSAETTPASNVVATTATTTTTTNAAAATTATPVVVKAKAEYVALAKETNPSPVVKAKAEYVDLVKEMESLTHTLQRNEQPRVEPTVVMTSTAETTGNPGYVKILEDRLKQRSGECVHLESQVRRLQSDLREQELQANRLRANAKAETVTLKTKLDSLLATQALQQEYLSKHVSQNASLEAEKEKLMKQIASLTEFQTSHKGRKGELEDRLEALTSHYQETITRLETKLAIQESRCVDVSSQNKVLTVELEQEQTKRNRQEEESKRRAAQLEQELQNEQRQRQQEVENKENECASLNSRVAVLNQELVECRDELDSVTSQTRLREETLTKQVRALEQNLEASKSKYQQRISAQERQNTEATVEKDEMVRSLQNCEECRKDLEARFQAKEKENSAKMSLLQSQLQQESQKVQEARQDNDTLRGELDQSQQDLRSLKDSLDATIRSHTAEIQTLNAKWQERFTSLQNALDGTKRRNSELSAKVNELNESLDDCLEEFDQYQDDAKAKEILLEAQVESLQMDLQSALRQQREKVSDEENLTKKVSLLEAHNKKQEERLFSLASERKTTEGALKLKINSLSTDTKEKDRRIAVLQDRTNMLEASLESRDDEISRLRAESGAKAAAESRTKDLLSQVSVLQGNLEEREREYSDALARKEANLKTMESALISLQDESANVKNEIFHSRSFLDDPNVSAVRKPHDIDLAKGVAILIENFKTSSEQIRALQDEKEQLKNKANHKERLFRRDIEDMDKRLRESQATVQEQSIQLEKNGEILESFRRRSESAEQGYIGELRRKLEHQKKKAEEQLSRSDQKCSELSTMVEVLTMEVNTCGEKLKSVQRQLAEKEADNASTVAQLAEEERRTEALTVLKEQQERANRELRIALRAKDELETALRESRTYAGDLQLRIKTLEKNRENEDAAERAAERQLAQFRDAAADTQARLQETVCKLSEMKDDMRRLERENRQLLEQKEAAEASARDSQASFFALKQQHSKSEKVIRTQEADRTSTLQELKKVEANLTKRSEQIRETTAALQVVTKERDNAEKECLELRQRERILSEKLLMMKERASEAESTLRATEEACSERESAITQLRQQAELHLDEQKQELNRQALIEESMEQIRDAKNRSDEERRLVELALSKAESKCESLADKDAALKSALAEIKSLKLQVGRLKSSELELNERIPAMEAALEKLPVLEATIERTTEQMERALDEKAKVGTNLREMQSKATVLEEALNRKDLMVQRIFEEKKSLAQDLSVVQSLETDLQVATEKAAGAEKALDELRHSFDSLQSQSQQDATKIAQSESNLKRAYEKLNEKQGKINQQEAVIKSLMAEKKALSQKASELQESYKRIQSLEEEHCSANDKATASEKALFELKDSFESIKTQGKRDASTIDQLESSLSKATAEIKGLEEQLTQQGMVTRSSLEEKKALSVKVAELEDAQRKARTLEGELCEAKDKAAAADLIVRELQAQKKEDATKLAQLESNLKRAYDNLNEKQGKINQQEAVIKSLMEEKRALSQKASELQDFFSKSQSLEEELGAANEKAAASEKALLELKDSFESIKSQGKEGTLKIDQLEKKLSEATAEIKGLEEQLTQQGMATRSALEEKKVLSLKVSELHVAQQKAQLLEEEIRDTKDKTAAAEQALTEAKLSSDSTQSESRKLESKLSVASAEIKSLQERRSQQESVIRLLLEEKKALSTKMSELQDSHRLSLSLEEQILSANNKAASAEQTLESAKSQSEQDASKIKQLESNLRTVSAEIIGLEVRLTEQEVVIRSSLEEKKALLQQISELQDSQRKSESLEEELDAAKDKAAVAVKSLEELKRSSDTMKSQSKQDLLKMDQLENDLRKAYTEITGLEERLSVQGGIVRSALEEKRALMQQISELQDSQRNSQRNSESLDEELNAARDKAAAAEQSLEELKRSLESMKYQSKQDLSKMDQLEKELRKANVEITGLEERITQQEGVIRFSLEEKKALSPQKSELQDSQRKLQETADRAKTLEGCLEKIPVLEADPLRLKLQKQQADDARLDAERQLKDIQVRCEGLEEALGFKDVTIKRVFAEKKELDQAFAIAKASEKELMQRSADLEATIRDNKGLAEAKESIEKLQSSVLRLERDNRFYAEEQFLLSRNMIELYIAAAVSKEELLEAKQLVEELQTRESFAILDIDKKEEEFLKVQGKARDLAEELRVCREGLDAAEKKNRECDRNCGNLETELEELRAKLRSREEEIRAAKEAKEKLENSLMEHGSDAEQLKLNVSRLNENLSSLERQNASITQELQESRARAQTAEEKLRDGLEMQQAMEAGYERMHSEKVQDMDTIKSLKSSLSESRSAVESLTERLSELEEANKASVDALAEHEALMTETSDVKKELSSVLQDNALLAKELSSLRDTLSEHERKISVVEGDLAHTQEERQVASSNLVALAKEHEELTSLNAENAKQLNEARDRISVLEDELTHAQDVKHLAFSTQKTLSNKLEELRLASAGNEEKLKEAENTTTRLMESMGRVSVLERELAHTQDELQLASSKHAALSMELEEVTAADSRSLIELSEAKGRLSVLEGELEHAQEEKQHALCSQMALLKELEELRCSNTESVQQLEEAKNRISVLEGELTPAQEERQLASSNIMALSKELEELRSLNAENAKHLKEAMNRNAVLEGELSHAQEENQVASSNHMALSKELDEVRSSNAGNATQLKEAADKISVLKVELAHAEDVKQLAFSTQKIMSKKVEELKSAKAGTEEKFEEAKGRISALEGELAKARQEMELVLSKHTIISKEQDKLQLSNAGLAEHLKESKDRISALENELVHAREEKQLASSKKMTQSKELEELRLSDADNAKNLKEATDRISVAESELAHTQQEKELLVAELEAAAESIANLEDSISKLKKEKAVLREEKLQLSKERDILAKDLEVAQSKIPALEHRLVDQEDATKSHLDALAAQMAQAKELVAIQQSTDQKLSEAMEKIGSLESELETVVKKTELEKGDRIQELEKDLKSRDRAHQATLEEIERHFVDLTNKVNAVTQKLQQKESQLEQLEQKTRQQASRIEVLQLEVQEKEALRSQLQAAGDLSGRVKSLEHEIEEKREEIDRLTKSWKETLQRLQEKEKESIELGESVRCLSTDLESSKDHLANLKEQLQSRSDDSELASTLSRQLDDKRGECAILEKKVAELTDRVQQQDEETTSLKMKLKETDAVDTRVESLAKELKEQQVLQEKVNESMAKLMKVIEDKSDECNNLQGEVTALNETKASLEAQVEALENELEIENEKKEKMNEAAIAIQRLKDEKDAECTRLSGELSNLRDQVAVMESDFNAKDEAYSGEMERLKSELQDQKEQCEILRKLNEEMQKTMGEADIMCNDLTMRLNALKADCQSYAEEGDKLRDELESRASIPAAELERLQKELHAQTEKCDQLSKLANEGLDQILKEKTARCNQLVEKIEALQSDCRRGAERIAELEQQLKAREDPEEEILSLKKELEEQEAQHQKMNQSMAEMLALWEEKEAQCAKFKLKLDELTKKLVSRDAQIEKLKHEAAEHEGEGEKVEELARELELQKSQHEETNECLEKMAVDLLKKEKEVARLTAELREKSVERDLFEHGWEIKQTKSEVESDDMREKRKEAMLKTVDEEIEVEYSPELELTNRLENLTSKIAQGEQQLADLEREFKEKWEQSSVQSTDSQARPKKKKLKVPKLLSRFRR